MFSTFSDSRDFPFFLSSPPPLLLGVYLSLRLSHLYPYTLVVLHCRSIAIPLICLLSKERGSRRGKRNTEIFSNSEGVPLFFFSHLFYSSPFPLEYSTRGLQPSCTMSYQPLDPTPSTSSSKSSITSSQLRKWRPFVLLAATALLLIALIPTGSYTPLTTAAHDLIHLEKFSRNEGNPTIAVAEMQALTSLMAKVSLYDSQLLFVTVSAL